MSGPDVMTDYQFKSIMKMAKTIVKSSESLKDAEEKLDEIISGTEKESSKE